MSFTGWSASNFIRLPSALLTGGPLTLAAWANTTAIGTTQLAITLCNSASTGDINLVKLIIPGTGAVRMLTADGTASDSSTTATVASANTWFHMAGTLNGTSSSAFINGGSKATSATAKTPTGINRASIGLRDNVSADQVWTSGGSLAEIGIWNAALDDAEIASLAAGIPPSNVRPQNLAAYLPLVRDLIDLKGNAFAIQGSLSPAGHCRIYGVAA